MNDSVKYIFKTLIKVPVIICVLYLIFNLFAFSFTYFKLLGFSYVVMQTAVENNYLPDEELQVLQEYLNEIASVDTISHAEIVMGSNDRKQYGEKMTVGVRATYKIVWPLMPHEQLTTDEGFEGLSGNSNSAKFADNATLDARRSDSKHTTFNTMEILYTVPGLKYYPDL